MWAQAATIVLSAFNLTYPEYRDYAAYMRGLTNGGAGRCAARFFADRMIAILNSNEPGTSDFSNRCAAIRTVSITTDATKRLVPERSSGEYEYPWLSIIQNVVWAAVVNRVEGTLRDYPIIYM